MFNLLTRLTKTTWRPQCLAASYNTSQQLLSSFTVREILYETSDEAGTLFTRFAKHIAIERYNFDPLVPISVRYSDFFPVHNMHTFSVEAKRVPAHQLPPLIIFASTYRSNGDPAKFAQVLNELDAICLRKLPEMDYDTLLNTLYALVFLEPGKLTRMDFYAAAVRKLANDFSSEFPKEKFVQACFYFGLYKKQSTNIFKEFVAQHLERYAAQLSTLDLAIVCNSLYKTSTPVQSENFKQLLKQQILDNTIDDALLITFLKELRYQRLSSNEICKHLAQNWLQTDALQQLQPSGMAHIYAFLAENRWDDEHCLKALSTEFLKRLPTPSKRFLAAQSDLRAKDLCTMLWASAQLNYKFSAAELEQLEFSMLQKYENGDFKRFPDQLVDGCLSLWTLGKKSRQLLQAAVQSKLNAARQQKNPARPTFKIDGRLTVLEAAASIEQPTWLPQQQCFNETASVPEYLLKQRPYFMNYQRRVLQEEHVASAELVCPIKGINIPSIFVQLKENEEPQKIFVELAEPEHLTQFAGEPMGMLRLKINLLTSLGYKVHWLSLKHLDGGEYVSLKEALNSETKGNPIAQSSTQATTQGSAEEPQLCHEDAPAHKAKETLPLSTKDLPQSDKKITKTQSSDDAPSQSLDKFSSEEILPLSREEAIKNI